MRSFEQICFVHKNHLVTRDYLLHYATILLYLIVP